MKPTMSELIESDAYLQGFFDGSIELLRLGYKDEQTDKEYAEFKALMEKRAPRFHARILAIEGADQ